MTSGGYPANSDWMPPKAKTDWQVTMTTGGPNNSSKTLRFAEAVRSAERSVIQQKKLLQADRRVEAGVESQLLVRRLWLGYTKAAIVLRQMVNCSLVSRPGTALLPATAIGGVLIAMNRSPLFGIVAFATVWTGIWLMLSYPTDFDLSRMAGERARLQRLRTAITSQIHERRAMLSQATGKRDQLTRLLQHQQHVDARLCQRRQLLSENWKSYRGVEFESFLEMVFDELGYVVQTTKVTGDQGADLIVTYRNKRIAIQVKGYADSVSNSAVQEAHTGMAYYRCDAAAVITNSRFTRSAIDVAQRVRCQLVDEDLLRKLILGQVDLWSMCFQNVKTQAS